MEYDAKSVIALLENIPKKDSFDSLLEGVKGIDARLADLGKPVEQEPDPVATLERKGIFDEIVGIEFQGIPIGQAFVGGFAAIFASELIDGFMADMQDWQRGLAKLGMAALSALWGKRLLGTVGSRAVALLLTFDAIRDFTPIDTWADQLAEAITGRATTAGLAGNQTTRSNNPASQARSNSYYAMALGGGG